MSEAYFVDCHGYFVELLKLMKLQTSKHVFDCRDADRFVICSIFSPWLSAASKVLK